MFRTDPSCRRRLFRAFVAALVACARMAWAADSGGDAAEGSHVGVTSSLTTSGYDFVVGDAANGTAARQSNPADLIGGAETSFEASYSLTNHTQRDLFFSMPRPNGSAIATPVEVPLIIFTVYDKDANVVWSSWTNPGNLPNGLTVLSAGAAFKLSAHIPLRVDNKWLDGTYVLVATVNGSPDYAASVRFEVSQEHLFQGRLQSPAAAGANAAPAPPPAAAGGK
jgi:hypothetical protein